MFEKFMSQKAIWPVGIAFLFAFLVVGCDRGPRGKRKKRAEIHDLSEKTECALDLSGVSLKVLKHRPSVFKINASEDCEISSIEVTYISDDVYFRESDEKSHVFELDPEGYVGRFDVNLLAEFADGTVTEVELGFESYAQLAVIKADDVKELESENIIGGFKYLFDEGIERSIPVSAGVLGNSLKASSYDYLEVLKGYWDDVNVELWNHGFDHRCNQNGQWEFMNSELEFQIRHLRQAQDGSERFLGKRFRSFGAPCNANDANTLLALQEFPEIELLFLSREPSDKILILNPRVEAEMGQKQNFEITKSTYEARKDEDFFVIQIHPRGWVKEAVQKFFNENIKYLSKKGVGFILPREFVLLNKVEDDF